MTCCEEKETEKKEDEIDEHLNWFLAGAILFSMFWIVVIVLMV